MSRRVLAGFGHMRLNRVVHVKTLPSSDSPDLHGQTECRGKRSAIDGV